MSGRGGVKLIWGHLAVIQGELPHPSRCVPLPPATLLRAVPLAGGATQPP
jgi:hypothetical protein